MKIPISRGMSLLHWYAENVEQSPGSVLDSDLTSSSREPLTAARARVLLIGVVAGRCPEKVPIVTKLHKIKAADVGKLEVNKVLPKAVRFREVHIPVIEQRSVLIHWCNLWRQECDLKTEINSTRSVKRINECTAVLAAVQRLREHCEASKLMYQGLIWFCQELELRIAEAQEEHGWERMVG